MSGVRPAVAPLPRSLLLAALTVLAMLGLPAAAHAGRLVVTGHDPDHHCARDAPNERLGACGFIGVAVNYVRAKAPDPAKPILVLDRSSGLDPATGAPVAPDLQTSLNRAFPGAAVPHQLVEPRSAEFAALPISTDNYSAILIGASKDPPAGATDPTPQDLNEDGSTPDIDAINLRADEIAAFFNAGGGIFVSSGGAAAKADSARYYRFLRITRGSAGAARPFTLTAEGQAAGWLDDRANPPSNHINCCITHLSFEPPAPESPLKVAEQDAAGRAVTLIADTNDLSRIEEPPANPGTVFGPLPGSSGGVTGGGAGAGGGPAVGRPKPTCVPKRALRVSLKRPRGVRFAQITVFVNGKASKTVKGRRLGNGRRTRAFRIRLSQTRPSKLRIVALTASGRKLTFRQTYRPCR